MFGPIIRTQEMSIIEGVPSAAYLFAFPIGQHNDGVAAYGYFDGHLRARAVDADFAVERGGSRLDVLQVAYERRGDEQVAKAMRAWLVLYAGEGLEQPFIDLSHHEVVERCALARVPLLGERGRSVAQLEAVARRLVVIEHGV